VVLELAHRGRGEGGGHRPPCWRVCIGEAPAQHFLGMPVGVEGGPGGVVSPLGENGGAPHLSFGHEWDRTSNCIE
jgi:hypothetical protein